MSPNKYVILIIVKISVHVVATDIIGGIWSKPPHPPPISIVIVLSLRLNCTCCWSKCWDWCVLHYIYIYIKCADMGEITSNFSRKYTPSKGDQVDLSFAKLLNMDLMWLVKYCKIIHQIIGMILLDHKLHMLWILIRDHYVTQMYWTQ